MPVETEVNSDNQGMNQEWFHVFVGNFLLLIQIVFCNFPGMLRKFNLYLELKEVSVAFLKEPRKFSKQEEEEEEEQEEREEEQEEELPLVEAASLVGCNSICLNSLHRASCGN
jgi:hypothetical protein